MVALALDTAEGLIDAPTIAKRLEGWVRRLELPEVEPGPDIGPIQRLHDPRS